MDQSRSKSNVTTTRHGVAPPAAALSRTEPSAQVDPVDSLAPEQRVHHYELIRELGRGGMGVVYAARDLKLGRRVAIKFLRGASREITDRFLAEARATAQCNHENIVIIHGADEHAGMPYMVLELIDGQSLRNVMDPWGEAGRPMPSSRVVELVLPIARALVCAHELGLVHRDLKPENVLVTSTGQVKVVDFGIAKALGAEPTRASSTFELPQLQLTGEGALLGTLPYMSPEQLRGIDVDHRTDVFAAGIIMFELLAGRHPIDPLSSEALFANLVDDSSMPTLRSVVPDVPAALAEVVDRCIVKQREHRLASARELVDALEALLPHRTGRRLAEGESPYPGLVAFQEGDADRFFGRSRDVARMVTRIREQPLTGVVGPSGVGKSSFVRAGVAPALKTSGETWEVVTLRPGRRPLDALASVLERLAVRRTPASPAAAQHATRLREEPGWLGVALRECARNGNCHILVFVDQLEELYTLVPDIEERRAFTAALVGAADEVSSPVRVVVSMRSDLIDRVVEDQRFMDELMRGLVLLPTPDRDSLRDALVQPVELVGYRFETAAMVGEMLDALGGTPGALPLLQFAAGKLWETRDRDQRLLSVSSYHVIGGISGALATHADEVVAAMSAPARQLTRSIFRRLVTPERTRAIVVMSELAELAVDRDAVIRVIDQLVAARLLVVQTTGDSGGSVEIVHESLIERWPTLRRWLDEDLEDASFLNQLAQAAKQWDVKGRPSGLLWRAEAMEEARRWEAHRVRTLPPRERAFLDAVLSLARRGKRRRRIALVAAFITIGAIAAGFFVAFLQIRNAESLANAKADEARNRAREAEAARKSEREKVDALEQEKLVRKTAEKERDTATTTAKVRTDEVAKTREQLVIEAGKLANANEELRKAVKVANDAKQKAEKAADDANKARVETVKALAEKTRRLIEADKKLSTMTKGSDLK